MHGLSIPFYLLTSFQILEHLRNCYTPANFVCGGYTVFTLSMCACVLASVRATDMDLGAFLVAWR